MKPQTRTDYILKASSAAGLSSGLLQACLDEKNTPKINDGTKPGENYRIFDEDCEPFKKGSRVRSCCGAGSTDLVLADRGRCPLAYATAGSDQEGRHATFVCGRIFSYERLESYLTNSSSLSQKEREFFYRLLDDRASVKENGIIQNEKEECEKDSDGFPNFCPLKK